MTPGSIQQDRKITRYIRKEIHPKGTKTIDEYHNEKLTQRERNL